MDLVFDGVNPAGDTRATFHFHGTVDSGQTSPPLYMPRINRPTSVAIHPSSSGRVEYTLSPRQAIDNGQALWLTWGEGTVTEGTSSLLAGPVMALRAVAIGGEAQWEVLI